MISVTIHKPDVDLTGQWDDLVSRSQPNVFMNPAALKAAADTMFAVIHVLLAWDMGFDEPKLIGLWALQERRAFPFWPKVLEALPFNYAFLSNPVIDRAFVGQVMPAFLAAIAGDRLMPNIITLRSLESDTSANSLLESLQARGGRHVMLKTESRPATERATFVRPTGERGKKLRQSWRRLSDLGPTEIVADREPASVMAAFEIFLTMEQQGWKGTSGTALLCNPSDAAFVRKMVQALAARGEVTIHTLRVDGRNIATQVVFFSGSRGYTWKTSFDESFARFSPGVVLIDRSLEYLLSLPGVEGIDSCSIEASFMAKICSDRQTMLDVLVEVGPRRSAAFSLEAARLTGREWLKRTRDRIQAARAARISAKAAVRAGSVEKAEAPPSSTDRPNGKRTSEPGGMIRMTEPSPSIATQQDMPDTAVGSSTKPAGRPEVAPARAR